MVLLCVPDTCSSLIGRSHRLVVNDNINVFGSQLQRQYQTMSLKYEYQPLCCFCCTHDVAIVVVAQYVIKISVDNSRTNSNNGHNHLSVSFNEEFNEERTNKLKTEAMLPTTVVRVNNLPTTNNDR